MPSFNQAVIMGHVGKDEMRYTPSGNARLELSVATNYGVKQADGTWKEQTTWHNVVVWGQTAERVGPRISKGALVLVQGRIDNRSWDDAEGKRHYRYEIVADRVQVINSRQDGERGAAEGGHLARAAEAMGAKPVDPESDLPWE